MGKPKIIEECPFCGSAEGFYTLTDYIGVPYRHGFHGEELENLEMYDNAQSLHERRYAYCTTCGEKIGTARQLLQQIERF